MNAETRAHILNYLKEGIRLDGRKLDEFRPISIEVNPIKTAEGSAIATIGGTRVIVGVKIGVEKPYQDTPDEGILMVGTELYPLASPDFESGPPGEKSIEIARVIDRGLRESKTINQKELNLLPGEKSWSIMLDVCALNEEGNLLDAGSIAALVALKQTRFPEYNGTIINYKHKTDKKIELRKKPIAITVVKIGQYFIVDPTVEEEQVMDARLTITTTEDNTICALQKGGEAPITTDEVKQMLQLAKEKAAGIREQLEL